MEKLISKVLQVMKDAERHRAVTGEAFNIYKVAGIDHDEVKTCKVIYELINPNGTHYQGNVFLKMFHLLENLEKLLHFQFIFIQHNFLGQQNHKIQQ